MDSLASPLAFIFKSFLIHGHISNFLLLCALVPIVKDNLGDKTSSSNYRAIAISSLFMKIFDWILLILFGKDLAPTYYQFGFMKDCSTTMCSWVVTETINYYTNRNTPVYCCLLDLTKAFDKVEFATLFQKLRRYIPSIFLRLLIFSYQHQSCLVQWNSSRSSEFSIKNGVRQGAVASPIFFSLYLDDLFTLLEKSNFGCRIGPHYYGISCYADDCGLLSPDCYGLQRMLDICKDYFDKHKITISTNIIVKKSKTKCIAFGTNIIPVNIILNDRALPWVESWPHLGHLLHEDETMDHDLMQKRGQFIGKLYSLRREFGDKDPIVYMKLVSIYLSSFYGSNLWDLYGDKCQKLYSSWNIMVKMFFDLPRNTHRNLIEAVSSTSHLKIKLIKRFKKFFHTLDKCDKPHLKYLHNIQKEDVRSVYGRNVFNIVIRSSP